MDAFKTNGKEKKSPKIDFHDLACLESHHLHHNLRGCCSKPSGGYTGFSPACFLVKLFHWIGTCPIELTQDLLEQLHLPDALGTSRDHPGGAGNSEMIF